MSAAEFKAKCLQAMDEVAETGEPVVVTKRGKPVAQLVPVARKPRTLRGFLEGKVRARGDLVAPTGARWRADRP
jgi:prevent-host-death family protein